MPRFAVVFKDGSGQTASAVRFGSSREALLAELRHGGLVPISIEPADGEQEKRGQQRAPARRIWLGRVKLSEVAIGFRTLATMLGGGLPIIDCLTDIADQSSSVRFKEILLSVATEVRRGSMLSTALAARPDVFSPLVCSLVQAGEESGNLTEVLSQLSDHLETQLELRRKVKVSMAYPMFIVAFFIVAVSVVLLFVLPKFREIFERVGAELPALTRIIMSVSSAFADYIVYIVMAVAAAGIALHLWRKTASGRKAFDVFLLHAPVVGKLVSQIVIARLARTLALLMESGIPVVEALKLVAPVTGNSVIGQQVEQVRQNIVRGSSLSSELASRPCFPRLLVRMAAAGEASGRLSDMLNRVATHYTRESTARMDTLMALLEPALLVFVGALVGLVVIAIYFPIFNLARTIG